MLNLKRLRHHEVGGPTNFEIIWAYHALAYDFKPSTLKRRFGDFIDYSIRPTPDSTDDKHLTEMQLLLVEHLDPPIGYTTHFTKSRVGVRTLLIEELKKVFDFSQANHRITVPRLALPVVPLQILEALLHPVIPLLHMYHPTRTRSSSKVFYLEPLSKDSLVYMHTIR